MRRSDREVTSHAEIFAIISQCDVCRLAFNDPNRGVPYILPLNFGFIEDVDGNITLYFHGANEGYKYKLMAANPNVSFEMDCCHKLVSDAEHGHCTMEYRSVMGYGILEVVEARDSKLEALTILTDNYHDSHFTFNTGAIDRTTVLQLKVKGLSAKQRIVKKT